MSDRRWQRLTIGEKQRAHLEAMREPAVTCPVCETQTAPADLAAHLRERCQGPREPHPRGLWVTWGAARSLGVPDSTIKRWVDVGRVRFRPASEAASGPRGGRPPSKLYYLRDLVRMMAAVTAAGGSNPRRR